MAGFRDLVEHLIVDFGTAGEGTVRLCEGVHGLQSSAIDVDARCSLRSVGWRLLHDHLFLRTDDRSEVVAGGGDEVYTLVHVLSYRCVESATIGEEKFVDGSCDACDWK
ncbi:unnamed protein product [Schistocephalus solidus]|uniref:Uncharacterized protein n=1 Tax=Schistocephalus solidus TaxID=70667 RepID=A0A183TPR9_SCHSO|nr:unnamed protein product [Schistocephalus solidus]